MRFLDVANLAGALCRRTAQHHHRQIRRKAAKFAQPVICQRRRRDNKADLPFLPRRHQQRNHLHGFAQAHVVRQHTAHVQPVKRQQPLEAAFLIRAQA